MELSEEEKALNSKLDAEIMQNPEKMPKAVYYIVPNEFGERFCFYGITPLLNRFFRDYMALGITVASQYTHLFKSLAYFTPLFGAAVSDTFLGKYHTIIYLSFLYVFGVFFSAVFATPNLFGILGSPPPLWGPLVGLFLVACGTGGIKPCVSAHGGDQFLPIQKKQLNDFYNYFYMSINLGSLIAGFITPAIVDMEFFGSQDLSYPFAFGICGIIMAFSLAVFMFGKNQYRVVPPSRIFMPWIALKAISSGCYRYLTASSYQRSQSDSIFSFVKHDYPADILQEVMDLKAMLIILIPAPFFWMAFDQNGSTWQNQYVQMNSKWMGFLTINEEQSTVMNGLMIILLVPVFTTFIYPSIEKFTRFRLVDRMIAGMGLAALAFAAVGVIQMKIDENLQVLEQDGTIFKCNQDEHPELCLSGMWQIIPYFLMTCGEILFSISGLNLTYQEVGKRTKASAAALWLFSVAIGNLIATVFTTLVPTVGNMRFHFLNTGVILAAMIPYFWIRFVYVYRADRPGYIEDDIAVEQVEVAMTAISKAPSFSDSIDVKRISTAHLKDSIRKQ